MAEQFFEVRDDVRCHLAGASSLFTGLPDSSLRGPASFWLYMRQSIRAAFLNEVPCKVDPALIGVDFTPAAEYAWTNRVTVLLARTCSVCWDRSLGPSTQQTLLEELRSLLALWQQHVPAVFQPCCGYRAEKEPFAVVRYMSPWHVTAWQFFYAAKVLVGSYRRPKDMEMIEMSR